MIWLLSLGVIAALAESQTAVWLRYGPPGSTFAISGTNSGTGVITVKGHDFADGDIVWIGQVYGNPTANGVRKIRNVKKDTFEIADLDGNPLPVLGKYLAGGTVGRVRRTEFVSSPRIHLDGPNGTLTRHVMDPDRDGGAKAQAVQRSNPAALAVDARHRARAANPASSLASTYTGETPFGLALAWLMDQGKKEYLEAVRFWLGSVEKTTASSSPGPVLGSCSESVSNCGWSQGSYLDWGSFWGANWAFAYNLVRTELSVEERRTFANKMLNGVFGQACSNRLKQGRGEITIASGARTVTGTGTNFLAITPAADGLIHVRGGKVYGTWLKVQRVVSDTELELAQAAPIAVNDDAWWWEGAWQEDSCGWLWWVSHHAYTPPNLTREGQTTVQGAAGAADTQIRVANSAAFEQKPPFFVRASNQEWLKVVEINGDVLTVERSAFLSDAKALANGATLTSTDMPPGGGMGSTAAVNIIPFDSYYHNLAWAKMYGSIMTGIALAEDDPRAARLVESTWNYWYDNIYPFLKDRWTGVTQGGFGYGPPRWLNWTYLMATVGLTSFSPQIDIRDGVWLKNGLLFPVYTSLPWNSKKTVMYADSGSSDDMYSRWFWHHYIGSYLYPGSQEVAISGAWLKKNQWYTQAELQGGNGYNSAPYGAIFVPPGSDCPGAGCKNLDNDVDPHYFFTQSDYEPPGLPENAYNVVTSRQDWSANATFIWMHAYGFPLDHLGGYSAPGTYRIGKKQWLMANGPYTLDSGATKLGNYVEVDGPQGIAMPGSVLKNKLGTNGTIVSVDRKFGNREYVYWRVNSANGFQAKAAVTRHLRNFVHSKSGKQDYLFVYDDVATSQPKKKIMRLHYYADNKEKGNLQRSRGSVQYTRTQARVSTEILLPAEEGKFQQEEASFSKGISNVTSVVLDDGETLSSEFFVVHRVSDSVSDNMPPVRMISQISPAFVGAVVEDAERPRVAIFSRNGTDNPAGLEFTLPALSQEAQIVVTGLPSGEWAVQRDGADTAGPQIVGEDGTALIRGGGGRYTLRLTKALVSPLKIASPVLPDGRVGERYAQQLKATGGTPPYSWSSVNGDLPPDFSVSPDGLLSGVPAQPYEIQAQMRVSDSSSPSLTAEGAIQFMIRPAPDGALSILTESLENAFLGVEYEATIEAAGGMMPYEWTLIGSLPNGLEFSADGRISGIPQELTDEVTFEVQCRDASTSQQVAQVTLSLSVLAEEPETEAAASLRLAAAGPKSPK